MADVKETLHAIYYVLSSKVLDDKTNQYLELLQSKIAALGLEVTNLNDMCTDSVYSGDAEFMEMFTETQNPNYLTEEDFTTRSTRNEFANFGNSILKSVRQDINKQFFIEVPGNKRYSKILLEKIQKLFIPTLPLWSNLLIGDLSRHGTSDVYSKCRHHLLDRGNTKIEKRFQILKNIALDGRSTKRLDELSVQIKEHVTAVQNLAVLKSVKPGKKPVARKGRSAKTVEESWDKRKPSTKENTRIGKYQKAPKQTTIDLLKVNSKVKTKTQLKNSSRNTEDKEKTQPKEQVVDIENIPQTMDEKTRMFTDDARFANTTINLNNNKYACELYTDKSREVANQYYLQLVIEASTGLKNMGNSCWFNSVVQLFSNTKLMRNINEQFNNSFVMKKT